MSSKTHTLNFEGAILARGFWLYIWEITTSDGKKLHYVGRTGDSSSHNAQSPFNRMGQHLGFNEKSNVLRRHLTKLGINPEQCAFRLVTHGPIFKELSSFADHCSPRDIVAAMEKALADAMTSSEYTVINKVHCRKLQDSAEFDQVLLEFVKHFPNLKVEG